MKESLFKGSLIEFITFILNTPKDVKLMLNTVVGAPDRVHTLWKVFYKDGTYDSSASWSGFIASLTEAAKTDKRVNIAKIEQYLKEYSPHFLDRTITFSYVSPDEGVEISSDVEDYKATDNNHVVMEAVREAAEQLSISDFRPWLREYLKAAECPFTFHHAAGAERIINELEEWLNEQI